MYVCDCVCVCMYVSTKEGYVFTAGNRGVGYYWDDMGGKYIGVCVYMSIKG